MCHTEVMRSLPILFICAFGLAQAPQQPGQPRPDITIRENVSVGIAPATVRDRGGPSAGGPHLQDFEPFHNSKQLKRNADASRVPAIAEIATQHWPRLTDSVHRTP